MKQLCSSCVRYGTLNVKVGPLVADLEGGVRAPLLGLDLANLLPVLRDAQERTEVVLAVGRPYPDIVHAPLIHHDAVYDRGRREKKVGWVNTDEDDKGVVYKVRLDVKTLLKMFDPVWVHLRDSNKDEKGGDAT